MRAARRGESARRPRIDRLALEPMEIVPDPRDLMTPELWSDLRGRANILAERVGVGPEPEARAKHDRAGLVRSAVEAAAWERQLSGESVLDRLHLDRTEVIDVLNQHLRFDERDNGARMKFIHRVFELDVDLVREMNIDWEELLPVAEEWASPRCSDVYVRTNGLALLQVAAALGRARYAPPIDFLNEAWATWAADTENTVPVLPRLRQIDTRPYDAERLGSVATNLRSDLEKFQNPSREPYYQLRIIAALDAVEALNYRVTTQGLEIERQGAPLHDAPTLPSREV